MSLSPALARPDHDVTPDTRSSSRSDSLYIGSKRLKKNKRLLRYRTFRVPRKDTVSKNVVIVPSVNGVRIQTLTPNIEANIVNQFGKNVGRASISDGTIMQTGGSNAFVQLVKTTCLGRCVKVGSDKPLPGTILLPFGSRQIALGTRRRLHCQGCGTPFKTIKEAAEHLKVSGAPLPLIVEKNNEVVLYRELPIHPEMQRYYEKAKQGIWDQQHLPQLNPEVLKRCLDHVVLQNYSYWSTPKYINLI